MTLHRPDPSGLKASNLGPPSSGKALSQAELRERALAALAGGTQGKTGFVVSFWSCPLERGGTGFVNETIQAGDIQEAGSIGRGMAQLRGWRYIEGNREGMK